MPDYFRMPSVGTPHVCGPDQIPTERPDGSMGWYVLHHSLDGREARE